MNLQATLLESAKHISYIASANISLKWNIVVLNLLPASICGQSYYKQGLTQVSRPLCDSKLVSVQFTLVACLRDFFISKYSMTLHGFKSLLRKVWKNLHSTSTAHEMSITVCWENQWLEKNKEFWNRKALSKPRIQCICAQPSKYTNASLSLVYVPKQFTHSMFVKLNNVIFLNKWKYVNLLIRVSL